MTAKEELLERVPSFSEAQALAALRAAEHHRENVGAAIRAIGDAFTDADPAKIDAEAALAAKEARAELAAERRG